MHPQGPDRPLRVIAFLVVDCRDLLLLVATAWAESRLAVALHSYLTVLLKMM